MFLQTARLHERGRPIGSGPGPEMYASGLDKLRNFSHSFHKAITQLSQRYGIL